jgi:predicted Zn-dependent protease
MEVFYGSLSGNMGGVAHWAHVGGFAFGMVAAAGLHYSGLENVANKAIEEEISWQADPEITQASELLDQGQFDAAIAVLAQHIAAKPNAIDGYNLLPQAYFRKGDMPAYQDAITKLCAMHLKERQLEAAWQDYDDFLKAGGKQMPAATWLELCRVPETQQNFDRALAELDQLAAAHPKERPGLMAQLGAGRICLKLERPQDALRYFQAAKMSPVPHLDLDTDIEAGIREATKAVTPGAAAARA